jgi:hypothetical protein
MSYPYYTPPPSRPYYSAPPTRPPPPPSYRYPAPPRPAPANAPALPFLDPAKAQSYAAAWASKGPVNGRLDCGCNQLDCLLPCLAWPNPSNRLTNTN